MPSITSVTFDRTSYTPGQLITATVTGVFSATLTLTATLGGDGTGSGSFAINYPLSVSDTGNRVWTPVSNNGTTAVFTATA